MRIEFIICKNKRLDIEQFSVRYVQLAAVSG